MEIGGVSLTSVHDLGRFIRDQRRNARLSLRKMSSMAGISNPYLSQIERGMRRPSAEILQAIARALRISAETLYVKAGILEERDDTVDPVTAILRDLALSDKQKQALIEVYHSFRHENEPEAKAATKASDAAARPAQKKRAAAARKPARKQTRAKGSRGSRATRKPARRKARA